MHGMSFWFLFINWSNWLFNFDAEFLILSCLEQGDWSNMSGRNKIGGWWFWKFLCWQAELTVMRLEQNPELRKGHAGSFVSLMHNFILIWKAKQATPFSAIQGTVDYLLMYLALEIIQGIHAIFPLAESWIVCLFFTSNPRRFHQGYIRNKIVDFV